MSFVLHYLLYAPILFLCVVVVTSQWHETAAASLRASVRPFLKWFGYTLLLVVVMQVLQFLFID
ncbi:MAG: hypothetical protein Fur0037_10290 [Planctomycetota bacterium]